MLFRTWLELFKKEDLLLSGSADFEVKGITSDSRRILNAGPEERFVFFARKGVVTDGHDYLESLAQNPKIQALVVERVPNNFTPKTPVIVVRSAQRAMAIAAKLFNGDPTARATTIATTGTNGKTTSTFLIQSLLKAMGKRPLRMGTIETEFEGHAEPSLLTTPDFSEIQLKFADYQKKGADAFIFEASSHALDQGRLMGLELDAALFTNLTPEHLDYHRTMESYYDAKQKLFTDLLRSSVKSKRIAVIPDDGAYGSRLISDLETVEGLEIYSWGFNSSTRKNHLHIDTWTTNLSGSEIEVSGLKLKKQKFRSNLVGEYNVENIAGMLTLGLSFDQSPTVLQKALDQTAPVSGRLERVITSKKSNVFVDYAHTPDALENVLMTLRPLTQGKLKVVFGCGGDRDRSKRPKMGAIAELYADELYVTSDNPRTEDPEEIIREILTGIQRLKPVIVDVDRRSAIRKSLQSAGEHDVVLIAGKGHENYQILGTERIHFDDREEALRALQDIN